MQVKYKADCLQGKAGEVGERKREAIAAAVQRARANHLVLSVNYTRNVAAPFLRDFLLVEEVRHVLRVMLPLLYVDERDRYHMTESQITWPLISTGCEFESAENYTMAGSLADCVAENLSDERAYYTYERIFSEEHTHHNIGANTTPLRLLTLRVIGHALPETRTRTASVNEGSSSDEDDDDDDKKDNEPPCYKVVVVCMRTDNYFTLPNTDATLQRELVAARKDPKAAAAARKRAKPTEFLCVRSFYFVR